MFEDYINKGFVLWIPEDCYLMSKQEMINLLSKCHLQKEIDKLIQFPTLLHYLNSFNNSIYYGMAHIFSMLILEKTGVVFSEGEGFVAYLPCYPWKSEKYNTEMKLENIEAFFNEYIQPFIKKEKK